MNHKIRNLSVQGKISCVYILTNLLLLIVNSILLLGFNSMSNEMEQVYLENLHLNELSDALDQVQDTMTLYLNSKTTDSLEEYYRSSQVYSERVEDLNDQITGRSFDRMERNIKHLSGKYLDAVNQTIEAKRGRNVEKYRVRYENATIQYGYISTYIDSLNNELFRSNSQNYVELAEGFRKFESLSIVIMFLVSIGNVLIIMKLTKTIISPLRLLSEKANEVSNGNLSIEEIEVTSQDEIGIVTNAFNQMVVSIRDYIEKIRVSMEMERQQKERELRMETHLKDAQLKYLQAQINPHFLFNSLNAGAQLAMMEGADRTYQYVQRMADFFRYNVKKNDELVTLSDEIKLVDNYIYILNIRFSGDIGYEKKVDPSLLQIQIPSMTLQPIVENCVNHGIREMEGKGTIKLSIYRLDDVVCISIKDNGIGMSEDAIEKILRGEGKDLSTSHDSNGIGMDNVIARLKLYSGTEDVMAIVSEGMHQGTEFIIYLPIKEGDEESV